LKASPESGMWLRWIALACGLTIAPWVSHAQSAPDLALPHAQLEAAPRPADTDLPPAPVPNVELAQNASSASQSGTGQQKQSQSNPTGQNQGQQTQQPPPTGQQPGNEPSLGDLGFTPQQTQSNAKLQAMLDKRTHMLKVHQRLGLITALPMAATLITGPMAKAKGRYGQTLTEPTQANLDFHAALGSATAALYFTTAYYAVFAPKVPGVKRRGAIRLHRALAFVHGPGMIATPILGAMAFKQEQAGEKVHGIASAHGTVAWATAIAYGAAIVSVSWPIKIHF
jgi:hypothetical protein